MSDKTQTAALYAKEREHPDTLSNDAASAEIRRLRAENACLREVMQRLVDRIEMASPPDSSADNVFDMDALKAAKLELENG